MELNQIFVNIVDCVCIYWLINFILKYLIIIMIL